jgi:hypothetical protein
MSVSGRGSRFAHCSALYGAQPCRRSARPGNRWLPRTHRGPDLNQAKQAVRQRHQGCISNPSKALTTRWCTSERNREQPNRDPGCTSAPRRRLRNSRPAAHTWGPVRNLAAPVWMGTQPGDTEGPDQKVTLQAWLAGRALAEVRRDLIRQIEEERSRREPRKRR